MGKSNAIALRVEDYSEMRHSVFIENNTTRTHIYESGKVFLVALDEQSLAIRAPRGICAMGHHLTFYILSRLTINTFSLLNNEERRDLVSVTAKVKHQEPLVDKCEYIEFEIVQVQEKQWRSLIKSYASRQNQLNAVVNRIKE
jgi:hypothetical protein